MVICGFGLRAAIIAVRLLLALAVAVSIRAKPQLSERPTCRASPMRARPAKSPPGISICRPSAACALAALLAQTADRIARELPFAADVDDFRRVLVQEATS